MREIPGAGNFLDLTVEPPSEPVERAAQLIDFSADVAQLSAAMQTRVVKRPYRPVPLTGEHIGAPCIFIHDDVARIGHFLIARRELPDVRPHLFELEPEEFSARVPRRRDGLRSQILIMVFEKK